MKQYTVKLNKPPQGTAGKTDCPFSMPTGRKEQPAMTIWILLLLPDTCHRTGHIRMISTVLWQRSKKLTNPDCKEDQDRLPLYLYPSPMLFLSNTFWYTRYWYSSSTPSSSSILEFHWPEASKQPKAFMAG